MADNIMEVVIQLRKDLESNYDLIKNIFVPMDGEICIVETNDFGLRFKVGNGVSTFAVLPYVDDYQVFERGYYVPEYDCFFREESKINIIPAISKKMYFDAFTGEVYRRESNAYEKVLGTPVVDSNKAGLVKLFSSRGTAIDGTMTQYAISNAIDDIKFNLSTTDEECLVLNKPW